MAGEGDPQQPSLPIWVTLLAVLGVILGGVAGALTGGDYAGPAFVLDLMQNWGSVWVRGFAGAILGFVDGLSVIAFDWFAPRQTPRTHPPVADELAGDKEGTASGKLPLKRIAPAFSFGQRLFAFLLWSVVGIFLIYGCAIGARKLSMSVLGMSLYERFWPVPPHLKGLQLPIGDWDKWGERYWHRAEFAVVVGEIVGGVILLICYSLLRVRLFVGSRGFTKDSQAIVSGPPPKAPPTRVHGWWGTISLAAVFIGLLFGAMLFLGSLNPIGGGHQALDSPAMNLIWSGFHVFGLFAAIIANKRDEPWWGLTVLGLVLNAVLLFLIVLLWMRQY